MDFYIPASGPEPDTPEFAVNLWRKFASVFFQLCIDAGPIRTN